MKKIFINVDAYNSDGIKTIQGNNNAETYKIYLLKNKIRLSLVNKTVKLGYVMAGTTKGDIIEDLNITNAEQGEITLPITNKISKKDGIYTCELAIYGADGFLEYTATFGLTVQANIFTKIAGEIENSKDLTYIERILEEATNVSEELKSNIPVARQLNSDLENQNRILNENIDRSNRVNNTLITTTEQSKVAATDAIEKKSQLESSIVKAKEFIDGLDGSQDIPSIRMELTKLQNGLKSNQALEYSGSSISANNTLEGRSEGMKVKGLTLQNLSIQEGYYINSNGTQQYFHFRKYKNLFKSGKYTLKNITGKALIWDISRKDNDEWVKSIKSNKSIVIELEEGQYVRNIQALTINGWILDESTRKLLEPNVVVLEGDKLNIIDNIPYFEGIKSFGEAEKEGDKFKVSLLSHGKNILKPLKNYSTINGFNLNNILKNGVQYTVTNTKNQLIKIAEFKDADTFLGQSTNGKFTFTFDNSKQQKLYIWKKYDSQVAELFTNEDIDFVMIEEGTGTIFEPYKEDKKDILIQKPLRGFAENTCDVMYEDNGQVKVNREVGKYTFTGDEGWTLGIQSNGWGEFDDTLVFYLDPFKAKTNTRFICDKFVYKNVVNIDEVGIYNNVWGNKPHPVIRIKKSELSTPDLEGFKSWLKTNPTTMIYQLAEPTIEIVENCVDIDLDTYQEKTYFNILNSLPGTLDFKVPSNIGSVVQNVAKEVNNIWDVINNLLVPNIVKANGNLAMIKLNNNLN